MTLFRTIAKATRARRRIARLQMFGPSKLHAYCFRKIVSLRYRRDISFHTWCAFNDIGQCDDSLLPLDLV